MFLIAPLNHFSLQRSRLINDLRPPASYHPKDALYPFGYLLNFPSMLYHLQDTEAQSGTSIILEEYRPPIFLQIMQDSGMSSEYLSSIFRRTLKNHNYIRMIRQG